MDLYEELLAVIDTLNEADVAFALCGGIAVAFYGYPRFTKDIDLLIRKESLQEAKGALRQIGYDFPAGPIPFDRGTPRERELHRVSKIEGPDFMTLDLLVVTRVFEDVWRDRMVFAWKDRRVPVVSRDGLVSMKRLAGRDQDLLDLKKLTQALEENNRESGA